MLAAKMKADAPWTELNKIGPENLLAQSGADKSNAGGACPCWMCVRQALARIGRQRPGQHIASLSSSHTIDPTRGTGKQVTCSGSADHA